MEPLGGHQLDASAGKGSRKKIFALIGCAVIFPIILTVGILALVFGGLYFGSKSTEEFKCAMSQINQNQEAIEILGKPIVDGYLVMPNIEISGPRREVNISVPVSGPKSSGTMTVNSYRDSFRSLYLVQLDAGDKQVQVYRGTFPCGNQ